MRGAVAVAIAVLCAPLFAQRPKPAVELLLRDGVGVVEGRLKARQQRTYSVTPSGHTLSLELAGEPMRSVGVEVYDPDGLRVLLIKEGAGRWTSPLSKHGAFEIAVVRTTPSAPPSTYRLRVVVR